MTLHYTDHSVTLHHGDCLDVLRGLPDASTATAGEDLGLFSGFEELA